MKSIHHAHILTALYLTVAICNVASFLLPSQNRKCKCASVIHVIESSVVISLSQSPNRKCSSWNIKSTSSENDNTILPIEPTANSDVKNSSTDIVKSVLDETVEVQTPVAVTGTVNERLLAELESAKRNERFGARSGLSPKGKRQRRFGLDEYRQSRKTEAERLASIEEAKNLNGINPLSAIGGAAVAIGCTALLWQLTNTLADYFALHPVENASDVYFVQRLTAVFRNVVIGLVSLATGYFGVTGIGLFSLGVRVAYGVATGELDPTPIESKQPQSDKQKVNMANMIDLMLNKKPGRKR